MLHGISKKQMILNFGPQHPASHGVLRLIITLMGEYVYEIDPNIGFLHRGTEKLLELQPLLQASVFMDRLDYTSVLTQTHAYCMCAERILACSLADNDTRLLRTLLDEFSRILNHLLSLATHALDIGTMATLFWAFEDRERIMELFEYVSGARMHLALYTPGQSLGMIVSREFFIRCAIIIKNMQKTFTELYVALYNNRVWRLRLVNIGIATSALVQQFCLSGPVARSAGVLLDLRLAVSSDYGSYSNHKVVSFFGTHGDSYCRYLLRLRELFESTRIIYGILPQLSEQTYCITSVAKTTQSSIEQLIRLFAIGTHDVTTDSNTSFVEAGKGIFGITITTNNNSVPYRVGIHSPAYKHLQALGALLSGHQIADIATLLGTLDIVFGEVDR